MPLLIIHLVFYNQIKYLVIQPARTELSAWSTYLATVRFIISKIQK